MCPRMSGSKSHDARRARHASTFDAELGASFASGSTVAMIAMIAGNIANAENGFRANLVASLWHGVFKGQMYSVAYPHQRHELEAIELSDEDIMPHGLARARCGAHGLVLRKKRKNTCSREYGCLDFMSGLFGVSVLYFWEPSGTVRNGPGRKVVREARTL